MAKMSEIPIWETPEEEREAKLRAVEEAIRQADAGLLVSHEDVRAWIDDLVAGRRRPPPRPK